MTDFATIAAKLDCPHEVIGPCLLINGDCLAVLPLLEAGSVDAVVTDPPYDAKTHAGAATTSDVTKNYGVAFNRLQDPAQLAEILVSVARRWALAFCSVEQIGEYARGAGESWVRAGVWDKIAPSPQITGDRPGQAVEAIAIMHRAGRKRWNRGGGAGIWRCLPPRGADRPDHPTPKPLPLMEAILGDFTDRGETILDPFMGSGTTGVACVNLDRPFIGIEVHGEYFDMACKRIEAAYAQGRLFA